MAGPSGNATTDVAGSGRRPATCSVAGGLTTNWATNWATTGDQSLVHAPPLSASGICPPAVKEHNMVRRIWIGNIDQMVSTS